jgi:hypothetical protein
MEKYTQYGNARNERVISLHSRRITTKGNTFFTSSKK